MRARSPARATRHGGVSLDPGEHVLDLRDEAVLRTAYVTYGGELYGVALRLLSDADLAEEAVQETFVKAWRRAATFDPLRGSLRGWLFTILRSVSSDLSHRRRPPTAALDARTDAIIGRDDATPLDDHMLSWQVEEALRRLSAPHREALLHTLILGHTSREAGASLGIPHGTVRSRVYYGLRALREILAEIGYPDAL